MFQKYGFDKLYIIPRSTQVIKDMLRISNRACKEFLYNFLKRWSCITCKILKTHNKAAYSLSAKSLPNLFNVALIALMYNIFPFIGMNNYLIAHLKCIP